MNVRHLNDNGMYATNWLLVIGYWLLVMSYWLLVIGYWLLAVIKVTCGSPGALISQSRS
jgi:hypothetical protein